MHKLKGHTNAVASIKYSNDGCLLASASGDNIIKIWKVADQYKVITFSNLKIILTIILKFYFKNLSIKVTIK